jgi:hypothetical protein
MLNRLNSRLFAIGTVIASSALLVGCGGETLFGKMSRFSTNGLCAGIIVILDVIALVEVYGSNRSTGDKILWTLLIIFAPVIGCLIYYFFGRK